MVDSHASVGAELLERAQFDGKRVAVNIARFHHAAFDGMRGQRAPLRDAIPLEALIVALSDAFDRLVLGRPRHPAVPVVEALKVILSRRGRDFDPRLVDLFIELVRGLQRDHSDLMVFLGEAAEHMDYFASQRLLRRAVETPLPSNH